MTKKKSILNSLLEIAATTGVDETRLTERSLFLYEQYVKVEEGKPKEITMHTVERIYPCISFYKAFVELTGDKEAAYGIINDYFTEECTRGAKRIQGFCRIPFVYRKMPVLMAKIIHKTFGVKSGFEMVDVAIGKEVCHIDMIRCPYHEKCVECGCPELGKVFCAGDDIAYGNIHKKVVWGRTKTLARGNECCDFILTLKE